MAEFKDRLKQAMEMRHLTSADLCRQTGFGKSLISGYVNGQYKAKADKLQVLAKVLDVNEPWLMGFDVDMKAKTPAEKKAEQDKLKVALFGGEEDVTDEMWQEVMDIVEYVKAKHKKG